MAALDRGQGVAAACAVGRGQAGTDSRVRPDRLALGTGSWPWHWGVLSRWCHGMKLMPASGAEANSGSRAVDQGVLTVHCVLSQ